MTQIAARSAPAHMPNKVQRICCRCTPAASRRARRGRRAAPLRRPREPDPRIVVTGGDLQRAPERRLGLFDPACLQQRQPKLQMRIGIGGLGRDSLAQLRHRRLRIAREPRRDASLIWARLGFGGRRAQKEEGGAERQRPHLFSLSSSRPSRTTSSSGMNGFTI